MNRSWQLVGLAGVIITLFGVLGGLLLGFAHFFALSHLILGGGLLTCYLLAGGLSVWISLLRGRKETSSSDRKREFWSWLGVFVLVCLLVVANVYVNHFDLRWDLTTEKRHSLSSATHKVLANLTAPLKIVGFTANSQKFLRDNERLELYTAASEFVEVEILDPHRAHVRLAALGMDAAGVYAGSVAHLHYGTAEKPRGEVRLRAINEEIVTNAILKLQRGQSRKAYFLEGHGEVSILDDSQYGYSHLATALQEQYLQAAPLLLATAGEIPSDASAVVVASPSRSLAATEIELIRRFVRSGGALLIMTDPQRTELVKPLVEPFGLVVGNDIVIDRTQRVAGDGAELGAQPAVRTYSAHPLTTGMSAKTLTVFSMAASVELDPHVAKGRDIARTRLLLSSESSWAESDLSGVFEAEQPQAQFDTYDRAGPIAIAAAYQSEKTGGRVVVFGDSDWIKNINFAVYHNRDLVLNAFNWLSGDDAAIAIHPVSRVVRQIPIPFSTLLAIGAACFIIPEILLLFGLCVWWSRQGRVPVTV